MSEAVPSDAAPATTPTLQRLELGAELRRIREEQNKTIEQVSRDLSERLGTGFSTAKISRLENAKRNVSQRDVRDLCEYYGVEPGVRDHLVAVAKASRGNRLQGVSGALDQFVALESIAASVYTYESMYVPGLLQTPDYTRVVLTSAGDLAFGDVSNEPELIDAKIRVRAERQERLQGADPLRLSAIMDENVVRRLVGSRQIMAAQLAHIREVSRYPNVTIRVVPIEAGHHPGFESAGFSILEFSEQTLRPAACFVEGSIGAVWAERDSDRQRISRVFDHLQGIALEPEATRALLEDIASELR